MLIESGRDPKLMRLHLLGDTKNSLLIVSNAMRGYAKEISCRRPLQMSAASADRCMSLKAEFDAAMALQGLGADLASYACAHRSQGHLADR